MSRKEDGPESIKRCYVPLIGKPNLRLLKLTNKGNMPKPVISFLVVKALNARRVERPTEK